MANKNEITKSALYEMVKKELVKFSKKQKLQEEKARLQAELNQLNEVMAGSEMDKGQDYHAGQKEPVFDVKGTHLTEEGEGEISSPEQVKSDGDLDKYIQGLIAKGGGAAGAIADSIDSNQAVAEGDGDGEGLEVGGVEGDHGTDWSGLGEAEINEGLENAIHWEGDIAKLYDHPVAKFEGGEVIFTDPDAEKALAKHVAVLKSKYDAAQGGDQSMVAEEEVEGEVEELTYETEEAPESSDEMLPEWLKEELDEMEDDAFQAGEEVIESEESVEDMGMYEMEEVSESDLAEESEVIEEEEVEEEVDLEKIQEETEEAESLNEGKEKSMISESFKARMQRLSGM